MDQDPVLEVGRCQTKHRTLQGPPDLWDWCTQEIRSHRLKLRGKGLRTPGHNKHIVSTSLLYHNLSHNDILP